MLKTMENMIIIGLTGPIGHGKTTFANALKQHDKSVLYVESSDVVSDVASAWQSSLLSTQEPSDINSINQSLESLPAIISQKLHTQATMQQLSISKDQVEKHPEDYNKLFNYFGQLAADHSLAEQRINSANKENYRSLLQWLGGYLVKKVDAGIWFNEIVRKIKTAEQNGSTTAIVSGLRYPSDAEILSKAGGIIIKIERPSLSENDLQDPTENQRAGIIANSLVLNNGSLEDLKTCAKQLLNDIQHGQIKPKYSVKPSVLISL
jgi:hypothetical protein